MKTSLSTILIVIATMVFYSGTSQAESPTFDPAKRLYTSDKIGHPINNLPDLLDRLLVDGKPVILFVHGRGNEPKKSLEGGTFVEGKAVHKLEKGYNANVLMFNWDSKAKSPKDRSRPLSNMPAASKALAQVINGIKQYREENPDSRRIALLAHSMGNIVFETMIKNNGEWFATSNNEPLFSSVLLSASDANDIGHKTWVEKISAIENVYITINAHDRVLIRSKDERPNNAKALGLGPGNMLAGKAIYVDATKLGKREGKKIKAHELFNKPSMHQQVNLCNFFQQTLTGQPVVLNSLNSTEVISGQRYKLNFVRDTDNVCFS
jgi:esterase/lipase superfamily enzyme